MLKINPQETSFRAYGYRWVVLVVFMLINMIIQTQWISYASIAREAALFYGVSELKIGFFAMFFMAVYIPLSIPVSWVIDSLGFHFAVGIGAVLMGTFGIMRGLSGSNYVLALLSTVGIAVAQPFLLNAWTKMPAQWFPDKERATAVGLITLSSLIGIAAGMVLSPALIKLISISTIQSIYGGISAFFAVLFIVLARENPPTPPGKSRPEERALMLDGLKNALANKSFLLYLFIFFVGMGIFNGITTWIENIIYLRGFGPAQAGTLGALLLAGGIAGAIIIPAFSDRQQKRRRFLVLGILLALPGLMGLAFARSFWLIAVSSFMFGFFLISISPVGMQYAVEITNPVPEGTSTGLVQLCGQGSVIFVYIMEAVKTKEGSFTPSLLLAVGLLLLSAIFAARLKEPKIK